MVMDERFITVDARIERVREEADSPGSNANVGRPGRTRQVGAKAADGRDDRRPSDASGCVDFVHPYRVM